MAVTLLLTCSVASTKRRHKMTKYLDKDQNRQGMPTSYRWRVDLDTALKERGMDGFYGRGNKAEEKKELHTFVTKKVKEQGVVQTQRDLNKGRLFNRKDMEKL